MSSAARAAASAALRSRSRVSWLVIIRRPVESSLDFSATRTRSSSPSSHPVAPVKSIHIWIFDATLLTFCPPGPPERMARVSIADSGIVMRSLTMMGSRRLTRGILAANLSARATLLKMRFAIVAILPLLLQEPDLKVFPADNPWNWDVSQHAVHPKSDAYVNSIGRDKPFHPDWGTQYGIPYVIVSGKQKKVPVEFEYADESDRGPYPIPDDAPIEGGPDSKGDRHILMIDRDNRILYEVYSAYKTDKGWKCGSGAIFKLDSNDLRPDGWTSADAAGLPIFPGLVRYDEVARGAINHALRFTIQKSQKAYVWPARHHASSNRDENVPPMGLRFRLKAAVDISKFPKRCQVILTALKKHGMLVADNGSDWFVSGAPDKRWNDDELNSLKKLKGGDFEAILTVDEKGKPIPPRKR